MNNKAITIIRPIDYGAEKECLKEFFRFIGCFLSDVAVETRQIRAWDHALVPDNEENGVDIVVNYFGDDPYYLECRHRRIRRIYCYFSFQPGECYACVTEQPLMSDVMVPRWMGGKQVQRRTVLSQLIDAIWKDEPWVLKCVQNIADLYTGKRYLEGANLDLFFCIQTRRSLRFLKMGEVLDVPRARVDSIALEPYLRQCLTRLWQMWVALEDAEDPYSRYTQVKAGKMMRDIVQTLRENDRPVVRMINFKGLFFSEPSWEVLVRKLQILIKQDPQFLSARLYLAGLSRYVTDGALEEMHYRQVLELMPQNRRQYAFIWYRMGHYYEKQVGDIMQAIRCYRKTVEIDPQYYQALFKLGYYAVARGRFAESEMYLNETIQALFHGRNTEMEQNGNYPNWLSLSLKESQYAFKTYILLAKVAINSNREYSAKSFIGKACNAATRFDEAGLVKHAATEVEFLHFWAYHQYSEHVWAIWRVLEPWTEGIILDLYLRNIVRDKLGRWPRRESSAAPKRSSIFHEIQNTKRMDV